MTRTIRMKDITGLKANATTAPFVTTEPIKIGGVRGGGSTPVDPPPSGDVDWATLLARTGTGALDSTFNPRTDITYVGAFRVPYFSSAEGNSRKKESMAFKPAEVGGRNGPNGSVFFGGVDAMAEVQIPTLSADTTDHLNLPTGTVLQSWDNIFERTTGSPTGTAETRRSGWLKIIDGKLHCSWYAAYSTATNTTNYAIIDNPADLANSAVYGLKNMDSQDYAIRYCSVIPEDKRALFGGNTYFAGMCQEISINARASFGHSFYGFQPESVALADTTVAATAYTVYPLGNAHYWHSVANSPITDHYSTVLGTPISDYVALSTSDRLTTFEGLTMPGDESIRRHAIVEPTVCGCAFIPPGTNTVCYIGMNPGMRYGIGYKRYFIEDEPVGNGHSGWHPWSKNDRSNVFWTMNINDIANAVQTYDPDYMEFGLFEQDPWQPSLGGSSGGIVSGDFDPTTGRLYIFQTGAPQSAFETQYIVSVYQVTGGA